MLNLSGHVFGLFVLLFAFTETEAQTDVFVTGNIEGSQNDSVFLISRYVDPTTESYRRLATVTSENGSFCFIIPSLHPEGETITSFQAEHLGERLDIFDCLYFTEPGDQVQIIVKMTNSGYKYHFSGQDMEKYIFQKEIIRIITAFNSSMGRLAVSPSQHITPIEKLCATYYGKIKSLIYSYQLKAKTRNPSIIESGCITDLYGNNWVLRSFENYWNLKKEERYEVRNFLSHMKWDFKSFSYKTIFLSRNYQTYLVRKKLYQILITNRSVPDRFTNIYLETRKLRGQVRDLLLINIVNSIERSVGSSADSVAVVNLWADAADIIENPLLKEYAEKRNLFRRRGAETMDFNLEDTQGNIVHLSDFEGKVVLIDVWFAGCTSCAKYNKLMCDSVYPLFKGNKNIVFISICADLSKESWRRSLAGGKYTHPDNVNLFSMGQGFEHPFLKYYEFNRAGATLLIGKNGRIFSGILPGFDASGMISYLRDALNEN